MVRTRWAAGILAGLLVAVLIVKWMLVWNAFTNAPWTAVGSTSLLFVALASGAAIGMPRGRSWGFAMMYLLVPVATFIHGIALVPFVANTVPGGETRTWAVASINVAVLVAAAFVHWISSRADRETEQLQELQDRG